MVTKSKAPVFKRIAVFGGASPRPGEPAYLEAEHLGSLLGQAGLTVITGGYIGTMEAVSKGTLQAGGHVVGITCKEIENWRNVGANPYVQEEIQCDTLLDRLDVLVHECDAAIALPGGVGTLAEILLLWNLLIIQAIPPKPLILVGEGWKAVLDTFFHHCGSYSPASQRAFLHLVPDVTSAVQTLWQANDR
jgi:hypothetical protein